MNKENLISIIIPVYNRRLLLVETLDTIKKQTYSNWECLVVDDGSTDNTRDVVLAISHEDSRIKLLKRPPNKKKGANACRNIGLVHALGDYIVLFDSDDFMTPDHLQIKLEAITKHNTDYVITKTKNLSGRKYPDHYYAFNDVAVTPYNYMLHNINWLTLDVIIKKEVLKNIWFNENLQSGQEYNFYSKLVVKTTNFHFVDTYVSLRREHENSVRKKLNNKGKLVRSKFISEIETLKDLKDKISKDIKANLLIYSIKVIYDNPSYVEGYHQLIFNELYKLVGFKAFYFELMLLLNKINKAYNIRTRLIEALHKGRKIN